MKKNKFLSGLSAKLALAIVGPIRRDGNLFEKIKVSEQKCGFIDFSKQIAGAKKILSKAKI